MSKDKISDYSATANSNTDIAGINIDEGCAPSGINNAIRTLMKQLKDFQQGTNSDSFNGPVNGTVGATTPAAGTFTTILSTGDVGIGTSSPGAKIDVAGNNTGLTSTTANNTFRFTDTNTTTATNQPIGKIEWYSSDTTTSARVGAYILSTAQGVSGGGNLEFATATNTGTVTEQMQLTGAGDLQFNSGYGSVATAYGCRAWVNFNGTGTVSVRASGNVSSITDNGSGDYDVNFTSAMPDVNYSVNGIAMRDSANIAVLCIFGSSTYSTSFVSTTKVRVNVRDNANASVDAIAVCIGIFR